ncbi:MAG: hypothetical protein KatS3mg002_0406 [Candidatus Woesearchaeota archaeon]|nr:MAG: hypothetical protein KatS3mg002_0406 [Candidatus Woesearchaeota archaeon]
MSLVDKAIENALRQEKDLTLLLKTLEALSDIGNLMNLKSKNLFFEGLHELFLNCQKWKDRVNSNLLLWVGLEEKSEKILERSREKLEQQFGKTVNGTKYQVMHFLDHWGQSFSGWTVSDEEQFRREVLELLKKYL